MDLNKEIPPYQKPVTPNKTTGSIAKPVISLLLLPDGIKTNP